MSNLLSELRAINNSAERSHEQLTNMLHVMSRRLDRIEEALGIDEECEVENEKNEEAFHFIYIKPKPAKPGNKKSGVKSLKSQFNQPILFLENIDRKGIGTWSSEIKNADKFKDKEMAVAYVVDRKKPVSIPDGFFGPFYGVAYEGEEDEIAFDTPTAANMED